ncbi:GTPase IMAP family member 7-like [Synchiropus splendidus]|uniref:GTPase IMAP family member 7-like n=1 Tax=Synchiropus splendidus TaxID=270530 RepID=UPI00237D387D|nr:GTPase IMAP family member 7-like [Synchiropus splendidus]
MSACETAESCEAPPSDLRLVLVGRTGSGRSSCGNMILGGPVFPVDVSPRSVTMATTRRMGSVDGRSVCVTDTPGFFHSHLSQQELVVELRRSVELCTPGPHCFLVTLQLGRLTQEERDSLEWFRITFGPQASRFSLVLFTRGDQLQGRTIKDFVEDSNEMSELVQSCHGGYHVFTNQADPQQVQELLEKVDRLLTENQGCCYDDQMLREAEAAMSAAMETVGRGRWCLQSEERREEEDRRKAERLFWCELLTAVGKGAAEGAGILDKDRPVKKGKVVRKAAALVTAPISLNSAAKVVSGAVREGSRVFFKHHKTLF